MIVRVFMLPEPGIWAGEWWPWQDWLAEQWGARSFRFRVLVEHS